MLRHLNRINVKIASKTSQLVITFNIELINTKDFVF